MKCILQDQDSWPWKMHFVHKIGLISWKKNYSFKKTSFNFKSKGSVAYSYDRQLVQSISKSNFTYTVDMPYSKIGSAPQANFF